MRIGQIYWDSDYGSWYVIIEHDSGEFYEDSQKIWFRVDVEEFGEDQEQELIEVVRAAYNITGD